MKKNILLILILALAFSSCAKKQMPTDTSYSSENKKQKSKDFSERTILNKIREAIIDDDYETGILQLREFERRYVPKSFWTRQEYINPAIYKTKDEILTQGQLATDARQYDMAFYLYRYAINNLKSYKE